MKRNKELIKSKIPEEKEEEKPETEKVDFNDEKREEIINDIPVMSCL